MPSTTIPARQQAQSCSRSRSRPTGGHGASTKAVYVLLTEILRDADVLLRRLKKDVSFALRRGTIAKSYYKYQTTKYNIKSSSDVELLMRRYVWRSARAPHRAC
jgi:hypothetical protein